jgi:type VI secretion system protein ImpF
MSPLPRRQPSLLLERLTGEPGMNHVQLENGRGSSAAELCASVCRELAFLFNATALTAAQGLDLCQHADSSALNYGVPDLSGKAASSIDRPWLERKLIRSIKSFEPRIRPDSVRVNVSAKASGTHNILTIKLDADLATQPAERLQIDTEFDLESGTAIIRQRPRLS